MQKSKSRCKRIPENEVSSVPTLELCMAALDGEAPLSKGDRPNTIVYKRQPAENMSTAEVCGEPGLGKVTSGAVYYGVPQTV